MRNATTRRPARRRGARRSTWSSTCSASTAADLTDRPLEERRELLAGLGLDGVPGRSRRRTTTAQMLLDATAPAGARGHRQQAPDLAYRPGERTPHWLKFAHRHRLSYVVGGWRPAGGHGPTGSPPCSSGEPTADGLLYRGRVGSGIGPKQSQALTELRRRALGRADSPFDDEVPRVDAPGHALARAGARRRHRHPRSRVRPVATAVVPGRPHRPRPRRTCPEDLT